jgi:hypothetical protein
VTLTGTSGSAPFRATCSSGYWDTAPVTAEPLRVLRCDAHVGYRTGPLALAFTGPVADAQGLLFPSGDLTRVPFVGRISPAP